MADIPRAIKAMAMLISVRMFDLTQKEVTQPAVLTGPHFTSVCEVSIR